MTLSKRSTGENTIIPTWRSYFPTKNSAKRSANKTKTALRRNDRAVFVFVAFYDQNKSSLFFIFSSNSNVARTDGLFVFCNTTRSPYSANSGVRNSSAQEGVKVITPSKSISNFSSFLTVVNCGRKAASASLPDYRETKVVPNFLR